jgi:DNA gyrase/topoisomerase IV subunit B
VNKNEVINSNEIHKHEDQTNTKHEDDYYIGYIKEQLKEKDKNLEGTDVREGLAAVISLRVPEQFLQFEGQTKGKLGTTASTIPRASGVPNLPLV